MISSKFEYKVLKNKSHISIKVTQYFFQISMNPTNSPDGDTIPIWANIESSSSNSCGISSKFVLLSSLLLLLLLLPLRSSLPVNSLFLFSTFTLPFLPLRLMRRLSSDVSEFGKYLPFGPLAELRFLSLFRSAVELP